MRRDCRPKGAPARTFLRVVAGVSAFLATAVLFGACHQLTNPADPDSVTYTGPPDPLDDGTDPTTTEPEPVMPLTAKWELATDHGAGVLLPLEITNDGKFVEPREATSFELRITFEDSFDHEQADGAQLWIAFTEVSGWTGYEVIDGFDRRPEVRQFRMYFNGNLNEMRFRVKLTDRNGVNLGERLFGRLVGDLDGNGVVATGIGADHGEFASLVGYPVDTDNPATIRADLDTDGLIEGTAGGDDWNVVVSYNTWALPSTVPELW